MNPDGNMTTQIIPKPEILLNKIQALPPEQLQQIEDFIEFLTQKYVHPNIKDIIPQPPRILGLQKGKGWMSEDFNNPLPDEFWLGEE